MSNSPCRAAAIFDVDGTLVDSNDAHAHAWVDAFAAHGIAVRFEQVRRAIGMGGDKLMPIVAGIEEDSEIGRTIAGRRGEIFAKRWLPTLRPFSGARELVHRLATDGFILAVASSAREEELRPLLEIAGVGDLIAKRTSSDDAERSKPDPDIVDAALKETGCGSETAIMVGDTPYDVKAAIGAGIKIVALKCGGWDRDDLRGAAEIYNGPLDLLSRYDNSLFFRCAPARRKSA